MHVMRQNVPPDVPNEIALSTEDYKVMSKFLKLLKWTFVRRERED
jgi:hypothetical protein